MVVDDVSPTLHWLVNITFVPIGVQPRRSGEAESTTLCPGAAATVTDEVVLVR
jgi:hypothetical protein